MTIQELIAEGRNRAAEADERSEQMIREAEDTAERKRAAAWSPVLDALRATLPSELADGIEIPLIYKAEGLVTIYVPDTDARIYARFGDKQWVKGKWVEFVFEFCPTSPQIVDGRDWDAGWYVGMLQDGDWTPDPLIALAQAVDYAEELPAVLAEAVKKNAEAEQEHQPAQTPEPSTQPVDWLAVAAAGFHDFEHTISGMQTAALLAIAQELRRMNDRNDRHDDWEDSKAELADSVKLWGN